MNRVTSCYLILTSPNSRKNRVVYLRLSFSSRMGFVGHFVIMFIPNSPLS